MEMIINIMDQLKFSNSSPDGMDSPKAQQPNTTVPDNKQSRPLEGGNSTRIGGMWTLKHDTIS